MAFTVQIINIENNVNNILLTDDLTIELLKVRYNWILNASIKNAVLGLDDYGLVWYMGEWICGEWEDGTWYSGIWHDGIWKNGRWYSYLLDKPMILTKRFVILEEDKMYSQFLNGKWYNGEWNNGIFGNDNNNSGITSLSQTTTGGVNSPYWYNGNFHNGLFKNSVWMNGIFNNGNFKNSYWVNGKFYNGYFDNYRWWNGEFYGGDFVKGEWITGTFNQIKTDVLARFGTETGTTLLTTWANGVFENGQFMSGLNVDDSGNTIASVYHNITYWKTGVFNNGFWFGGHFASGTFNYGKWYGGIFNTNSADAFTQLTIWKNGLWYNGLWMNGVFKSGMFFSGMWLNGIFENGFLISEYQGTFTQDLKQNVVPQILPPPPPPPTYYTPTTIIVSTGSLTYKSCIVNCNVTSIGGLATVRGICYSTTNPPTKNDNVIYDTGTGSGTYSCTMVGLNQLTTYYVRSFATNSLGTSYSSVTTITTPIKAGLPTVQTTNSINIAKTSADLIGTLTNIGLSSIIEMGFYYSTTNPPQAGTKIIQSYSSTTPPVIYNKLISGLSPNTKYYYVSYAENSDGKSYGIVLSFTTQHP